MLFFLNYLMFLKFKADAIHPDIDIGQSKKTLFKIAIFLK